MSLDPFSLLATGITGALSGGIGAVTSSVQPELPAAQHAAQHAQEAVAPAAAPAPAAAAPAGPGMRPIHFVVQKKSWSPAKIAVAVVGGIATGGVLFFVGRRIFGHSHGGGE